MPRHGSGPSSREADNCLREDPDEGDRRNVLFRDPPDTQGSYRTLPTTWTVHDIGGPSGYDWPLPFASSSLWMRFTRQNRFPAIPCVVPEADGLTHRDIRIFRNHHRKF